MEAFNRLAEADAPVQAVERERDEALSQAAAAKMAKEEAERKAFVNQANAIKMAELNLRAHSEVVHLKRMLAEARGLRDSEVAQASQTARHKTSEVFIAKLKAAEQKVSLLHGINNQFMYLSRARANLQLIKVLEEGGVLVTEKDREGPG